MFAGKEDFKIDFIKECIETMAKPPEECSNQEKYEVLVRLVSSKTSRIRTETSQRHAANKEKKIYYFSMEFLIGRLLENYLINTGDLDIVKEGLADLGDSFEELCRCEQDPGLGNGGLGRLAACFLDSMAFLGVPGVGMGIRYRFGLFRQKIVDGYQTEEPDTWLEDGYPWEVKKPDDAVIVKFGGTVDRQYNNGKMTFTHRDYQVVNAVPYDVPIVGYGARTVNVLRLWRAQPVSEEFDLAAFNRGEYSNAVRHRNDIEAITCILYPNDSNEAGQALRLKQEYFFVAAGIASIIKQYKELYGNNAWAEFPEHVSIHTNDTHPALCVPELMRVLMDEEGLEWVDAWDITTRTVSYTNHTILPEALEKWPIPLVQSLLPRVYLIIEEIDRRYRESFDQTVPGWYDKLQATAILWDNQVKMANLSVIGSYSVNGVAALHTEILKTTVLKEFCDLNPEKFNNKTNGVSHRRFLIQANPGLTRLISSAIGDGWKRDPVKLSELNAFKSDSAFLDGMRAVKRENKERLAEYIYEHNDVAVNPDSVFDVQVKRIHAYKRQLLAAFKILHLYNVIKDDPTVNMRPYTFLFAGKAAQSYAFAKDTIKFINSIADVVNNDPAVEDRMKVVFIENFNVSNAQLIYPAANISEQISTAGKEASGTGNMKFMFNGAVTLGTLDGANLEIREKAGEENFQAFGMSSDEVMSYYVNGGYSAMETAGADPRLKRITDQLVDGFFGKYGSFWGIYDALLHYNDEYFVLKDFASYIDAWQRLDGIYGDKERWEAMSLANIAGAGYFSSDRCISEYCRDIWHTRYDKY